MVAAGSGEKFSFPLATVITALVCGLASSGLWLIPNESRSVCSSFSFGILPVSVRCSLYSYILASVLPAYLFSLAALTLASAGDD